MIGNACSGSTRDRLGPRAGRSSRVLHISRGRAVHLGAARAALRRLAVPAHGEVLRLACAGSRAPRRGRPCPLAPRPRSRRARRPACVAAPELGTCACSCAARPPCARSTSAGERRRPSRPGAARPPCPSRVPADDDVVLAPVVVVVREVEPAVRAAALVAQRARRARPPRRTIEHVAQVAAEVPAGVVAPLVPAGARRRRRAASAPRSPATAAVSPASSRKIPTSSLHRRLQLGVERVRILVARSRRGSASSRRRRRRPAPSSICGRRRAARVLAPRRRRRGGRTRAGPRASCRRAGWRRSSRPSTRPPRTGPRPCSAPVSASTRTPPMM